MTDGLTHYRKTVRKSLRCGWGAKRRLLAQFDDYCLTSAEDSSVQTYDQIAAAFGPPEEMAHTLMQEVTPAEQAAYQRSKLFLRICAGILAAAWVMFTLHTFFIKEVSIKVIERTYVYDISPEYIMNGGLK